MVGYVVPWSLLYSMKVAKMHEDKYVTWTHMYKCIGNMHILTTKKKLTLEDIKGSLVKRLPGMPHPGEAFCGSQRLSSAIGRSPTLRDLSPPR